MFNNSTECKTQTQKTPNLGLKIKAQKSAEKVQEKYKKSAGKV